LKEQMSSTTSRLQVRIFDGSRQPFAAPADFLITILDGNQKQIHRDFHKEAVLDFDCPFYDNFGDLYSVTASCDGPAGRVCAGEAVEQNSDNAGHHAGGG